jgi:hypothetical protein
MLLYLSELFSAKPAHRKQTSSDILNALFPSTDKKAL